MCSTQQLEAPSLAVCVRTENERVRAARGQGMDSGLTSEAECEKCSWRMRAADSLNTWWRARRSLALNSALHPRLNSFDVAFHPHVEKQEQGVNSYFIIRTSISLSIAGSSRRGDRLCCLAVQCRWLFRHLLLLVSASPRLLLDRPRRPRQQQQLQQERRQERGWLFPPAHLSLSLSLLLRCLIDAWPASPPSLLFGPTDDDVPG